MIVKQQIIVQCTRIRHADDILSILNEAIVHTTALYDYKPRPRESMDAWFNAKTTGGYPVIGVEDSSGVLRGFGSYGAFRTWPAYKYTVEHSVYVQAGHRGRGIGRKLMHELIASARRDHRHAMIGGIDAANTGSIRLHEQLGFRHAGTLPQVGFKFGRWLDLAFYQLLLDTPETPVDG
jgi:L-amino acid N-acyltransferase